MRGRFIPHRVVLFALMCLGLSLPVFAQAVGGIGGTITDASGAVLPGVSLTMSSPGLIGSGQTTVSDAQGNYQFSRLVPGTYSVKAELQGFQSTIQEHIEVNSDRTSRADIKLAVGEVAETVTVSGVAPLLDTTSALKQTVMSRTVIDSVPAGADVWSIARLVPAVQQTVLDVGGRNMPDQGTMLVHGSNSREQGYLIDGFDITAPQESALQAKLDTYSAAEINVQAGQTPAEFQKSGVVMNIITKTGTNKWAGTVQFAGSNHSLESNNITDPKVKAQLLAGVPAFALAANPNLVVGSNTPLLYDSSFTLGGPIEKDRLWVFGSANNSVVNRFQVGSYNADGSQLEDDNRLSNLMIKGSVVPFRGAQFHALVNWSGKLRAHQNGATTTQFSDTRATQFNNQKVWIGIYRFQEVLTSRLLFDVGGMHIASSNDKAPQPEVQHGDIPRFDAVTNQISVASPTYSLPTNTYKQVVQSSVSYVAGQHDLKVGWQLTRGVRKTYFLAVSDYPAGLQAIYKNGVPDSVKTFNTPTGSDYTNLDNSLYVQDKWRIGHKLTANVGLRFDHDFERVNDGTSPICQTGTIYIAAQCFPAISGVPNLNILVPRLSAIYDVYGNGRTALKFVANRYLMSQVGQSGLVNPIKLANDTRAWTKCAAGQTSGCDLNGDLLPQLNELGPSSGFNLGVTNRLDPNLKVPYVNEIAAEIEQQLGAGIVVSAGYHYRGRRNVIGATNLLVPTSTYLPLNVTEVSSGRQVTVYNLLPALNNKFDVLYANHPELNDSFHGVDITAQKRMSNHWMLMGSLSFATSDGDIYTVDGQNTQDLNNPNIMNRRGPQPGEVPVNLKIAGVYELPYGVRMGSSAVYIGGTPLLTTVRVGSDTTKLTQSSQTLTVEPFGTARNASTTMIDFDLTKSFRAGRMRIEPRMEIFNALNAGVITNSIPLLGPTYGAPISFLPARLIKFGVNLAF
jgi:hypothetical protein